MAEEVALKLDIQTGNAGKTLKELKQEIKDANAAMSTVQKGSKAYYDLAKSAGNAKEEIKDIKEATNLFTKGGTISE